MRKEITTLMALVMASSAIASPLTPEQMLQRAKFLAEHPAVAKVLPATTGANQLPTVSLTPKSARPFFPAPPAYAAALPVGWCNVVGDDTWTGRYSAYGVYSFNPVAGFTLNKLHTGVLSNMKGNGGAVKIGNRYYLQNWAMGMGTIESTYHVYNTDTWEEITNTYTGDGGLQATDLAYDRLNNVCYGAFFKDDLSGWELGTIAFDDNYPYKTTIGEIPLMVAALAVNKAGELYGICEDGVLYKFDTETAEMTRIGDTGVKVAGYGGVIQQSGEFDQHTDIFYWASRDAYGKAQLYTVDVNTAEVQPVSDIANRAAMLNMQFMAPAAADKAPNFITEFETLYPLGTLTGAVKFRVPEDCYDGSTLEQDLTYTIKVNGIVKATGQTSPGAQVKKQVIVNKGKSKFEVSVSNSVGSSPVESVEMWIGEDTPIMKEVKYTADGLKSTVEWSIEEKGRHGGWISSPTFNVKRMPDGVQIATGTSATSITDNIPADAPLAKYTYVVTPINDGESGDSMTSNSNIVGSAITPPYYEPFDDGGAMSMMTILDNNKDGITWGWGTESWISDNGLVELSAFREDTGIDMDDWILTPPIHLEAGKSYNVSFKARTTNYEDGYDLIISYGSGDDVSKYKSVMPTLNVKDYSLNEHTATISSDKEQDIRIAFGVQTNYFEYNLQIDDIRVSAPISASSPAACENVEIIADAQGELEANVKFTTPSLNKLGAPLQSLDKVEIYCDNILAATMENPAVGTALEKKVQVASDGEHAFRVVASSSEGAGEEVVVKQFVGVDRPGDFKAWLEDKQDHILLKWEPCTKGAKGHYVNPDQLTYDIYQVESGMLSSLLASDVTETEATIPYNTDEGPIGGIQLAVMAKNRAGTSGGMATKILIVGKPYDIPYIEHFTGDSDYIYDGDADEYFNLATGTSSDDDNSCFAWLVLNTKDNTKDLATLKINSAGDNTTISADVRIPENCKIEILAMTPDMQEHSLCTAEGSGDGEWKSITASLKDYASERYVRVIFRFHAGDTSMALIGIDNIAIIDAKDHDLELTAIGLPTKSVHYGQHADLAVTVTSLGLLTSGEYTVSLFAGDNLIESQTASGLDFMKTKDFHFSHELTLDLPSTISYKAVVEYPSDQNSRNNQASATLNIVEPKVSSPENLQGELTDKGVSLKWEKPSAFYYEEVTEDFESYAPWTITAFGDWTVWDKDGAPVIGLTQAEYPNKARPQAFTIFNPSSIGMPEANTEGNPYSGQQYLACFAADVMETENNDDWLVSPLLTGEAQTISFYAKQMTPYYGDEKMEVLYSTGSLEAEDFVKVADITIDNADGWEEFTAQLPLGAKYFALRVVTRDGHICMIDNVSYTAGSCTEITGWNIYRDSKLIATVPGTQLTYIDANAPSDCVYNVTAEYATGEESAFSNSFNLVSAVESLFGAGTTYDVYSIDGRVIRLKADNLKGLEPGIYIINGRKLLITK